MKSCVMIFLGFIILTAVIIYIIYMCNLHNRVSRLEARSSDRLAIIEREIHGVSYYIRIIMWLAVLFCVGICTHYIAVFYPRFIEDNKNASYIQSFGIDYWGIIVGFMAVIVTLLVGWQIYSTIKAKDEIERIKAESDNNLDIHKKDLSAKYENRIAELEKCCRQVDSKLKQIEKQILNNADYAKGDALFSQGTTMLTYSQTLASQHEHVHYDVAYRSYFKALYYYIKSDANFSDLERCFKVLRTCLERIDLFRESVYLDCDDIYEKIIVYHESMSEETEKKLERINTIRQNKPYYKEFDR